MAMKADDSPQKGKGQATESQSHGNIREFNELSASLGSDFAKANSARYLYLAKLLGVELPVFGDAHEHNSDAEHQGYVNDPT
jgi:hypothetical protein